MGVKLTSILGKKDITFEILKGKVIAVDFSNYAYQFLSSIRQLDGTLLMDSNKNVTSHLMGIWTRFSNLINKNIKLVVILDGKMPLLKKRTTLDRFEKKEIAKEKYELAVQENDLDSMNLYAKQTSFLTKDMISESRELIDAMGIPILQAPAEADAQMAYLCKKDDVWAAATSDIDPLLHGCKRTVTNLTLTQRKKLVSGGTIKINPQLIDLEENLTRLGITREQLIVLSILVGTDYNPGIKGIGPKKALKLVKKSTDYKEIFKTACADFNWVDVYNLFEKMEITKNYNLKWNKPDQEKIKDILILRHEFNEKRVNKVLEELQKGNKSFEQTGLDTWVR